MPLQFRFSDEKSQILRAERGLGFEDIIAYIEADYVVDDFDHPNQKAYRGQRIFAVNIDGYIWLIPYRREGNTIHLVTAFPSRKAHKIYQEGDE